MTNSSDYSLNYSLKEEKRNILIELSILFMLFWREKIKTKRKILMICFIFYLNCLNDKEEGLKLSIYKKNTISFKLENLDTHLF